eukprot:289998_1
MIHLDPKAIGQEYQDTVFGYIRINKNIVQPIPQPIKHLSLLYYYESDQWDPQSTHKTIKINGNTAQKVKGTFFSNSYLTNVIKDAEHIWKFKVNFNKQSMRCLQIGIWKTKFRNAETDDYPNDGWYGYDVISGWISDPNSDEGWYAVSVNTGVTAENGDIVEMRVNFKSLSLSYKIGDDIIHAFKIENTAYRATISLSQMNQKVTLLSYQKVYQPQELSIQTFEFDKRRDTDSDGNIW